MVFLVQIFATKCAIYRDLPCPNMVGVKDVGNHQSIPVDKKSI